MSEYWQEKIDDRPINQQYSEVVLPFDAQRNKRAAMKALKKMGAVSARIEYSGGNDEGGVGHVSITLPNDETKELEEHWRSYTYRNGTSYRKPFPPDVKEEGELVELLSAPIYDQWGSFAGDFYTYGTLTFVVESNKVEWTNGYRGEDYDHTDGSY